LTIKSHRQACIEIIHAHNDYIQLMLINRFIFSDMKTISSVNIDLLIEIIHKYFSFIIKSNRTQTYLLIMKNRIKNEKYSFSIFHCK
jgi:hypothetical protein